MLFILVGSIFILLRGPFIDDDLIHVSVGSQPTLTYLEDRHSNKPVSVGVDSGHAEHECAVCLPAAGLGWQVAVNNGMIPLTGQSR